MSTDTEPTTSVNWNGLSFTGYASKGERFGEGQGETAADAVDAATKALGKSPDRTPPEAGATGAVVPTK